MKDERFSKEQIKSAFDAHLSGIDEMPSLQDDIMRKVRGETVVKKKLSVGLILVIVLIMLALGIGVAANLGVFGKFAMFDSGNHLASIERIAKPYTTQSVQIEAENYFTEATFTLNQAHYDGQTLYCAYTLSKPWIPVILMNPNDVSTEGNDILSEQYRLDSVPYFDYTLSPEDTRIIYERLLHDDKIYFEVWSQYVVDVKAFAWETEIPVSSCDVQCLSDGTSIGYMAFRYPLPEAVQNQEELMLEFQLARNVTQFYQDDTGLYEKQVDEYTSTQKVPVTILKSARSMGVLRGQKNFEGYNVSVILHISEIDLKMEILIRGEEDRIAEIRDKFIQSSDQSYGGIYGYNLYAGDTQCQIIGGPMIADDAGINIKMTFELPENLVDFQLVPSYDESSDNSDEIIYMQKDYDID